jgi:hypothetical protein
VAIAYRKRQDEAGTGKGKRQLSQQGVIGLGIVNSFLKKESQAVCQLLQIMNCCHFV